MQQTYLDLTKQFELNTKDSVSSGGGDVTRVGILWIHVIVLILFLLLLLLFMNFETNYGLSERPKECSDSDMFEKEVFEYFFFLLVKTNLSTHGGFEPVTYRKECLNKAPIHRQSKAPWARSFWILKEKLLIYN